MLICARFWADSTTTNVAVCIFRLYCMSLHESNKNINLLSLYWFVSRFLSALLVQCLFKKLCLVPSSTVQCADRFPRPKFHYFNWTWSLRMAQNTIVVLKVLFPNKALINGHSSKYKKRFWNIFENNLSCRLLDRNFAVCLNLWPVANHSLGLWELRVTQVAINGKFLKTSYVQRLKMKFPQP